jgi:hypothetical protein
MFFGPAVSGQGLQILASDQGPGLGDLERAMTDGYTTRATPGLGLGTVRRQSDRFDVYSRINEGTLAMAQVNDRTGQRMVEMAAERVGAEPGPETAVLSTCIDGELVNGDSWAVWKLAQRTLYLMVDGLGHGHNASVAAQTVIRLTDRALARDPATGLTKIVQELDMPMRATRGAAVMLLEARAGKVVCCGVGNISAALCSPDATMRSLVSHNGTVGHRMTRVQEFEYPWVEGTLLVAHSDGLATRWKMSQYPGLMAHEPGTIAGVIYRDAVRGRDDATVLVSRLTLDGVAR